jgi:hypothetical protein
MEKIVIDSTEEVVIWVVDKINQLIDEDTEESRKNAISLIEEYQEWINALQDNEEINYTAMKSEENEGWTEEQEIDIQDPWA